MTTLAALRPAARRQKHAIHASRAVAATMQAGRCFWCGVQLRLDVIQPHPQALTADHIVPASWGGADDETNVVAACYACNQSRAHHGVEIRALVALVVAGILTLVDGVVMSKASAGRAAAVYERDEFGTVIRRDRPPQQDRRAHALHCAARCSDMGEPAGTTLSRADAFLAWLERGR